MSGGLKILPGAGEPSHRAPVKPVSAFALVGMGVWLILQIALPARAWFIPTEVRWTGDGHRYSWRMRIYDRVAVGRFIVTADGQRWIVDPADHLSHRQARMMLVRPDMIYQFAHYLKADREKAGYTSIAVQADIWKSLNGRPMQRYIDPDVDLITAPFSPIGSNSWVLPLDIPVWGVLRPNRSSWRSHESPLAPATISSLTW
ncbi:hypothetical protein [Hoeflea halophila]|uniref:hypothetical protein n=1 Tax=Hoeflea halophila TaxID=714899 RepID=UPI003CCD7ED2